MTEHESRQLREDLMVQFTQMMSEELPPGYPESGEYFPQASAQKH